MGDSVGSLPQAFLCPHSYGYDGRKNTCKLLISHPIKFEILSGILLLCTTFKPLDKLTVFLKKLRLHVSLSPTPSEGRSQLHTWLLECLAVSLWSMIHFGWWGSVIVQACLLLATKGSFLPWGNFPLTIIILCTTRLVNKFSIRRLKNPLQWTSPWSLSLYWGQCLLSQLHTLDCVQSYLWIRDTSL